jgi:phosphoenolpyruvate synthase/pyruvate phosphate dikinase
MGRVLDMLLHAGLLVPKGMVLNREAHRAFLEQSGLIEELQHHPGGEDPVLRASRIYLSHRASIIKAELNQVICDSLIELGSPSVAVISEGSIASHLKSIPEVKDAIKKAWLPLEGVKRQLEVASRGLEIPTWPVLILAEED